MPVSSGLRAGLLGLAKSLSDEVARDGITVNAILPGYTVTEEFSPSPQLLEKIRIPPRDLITWFRRANESTRRLLAGFK
jgi:3-oxoacyl-[acyl-carrier protein] reductase